MAERKEIFSVPYRLIGGRYLGTTSRVLLTGTLPNYNTQLDILNLTNIEENKYHSDIVDVTCQMRGICTAIDVYGHSSLGKSFVALATHENGSGKLSIYEIPTANNDQQTFRELFYQKQNEDSIYTNITSHSNNNHLTACTEFGDVIIHDYSGQEITRFNADYCGLNAIKYSNSGDLITLGLSSGGQLSLWDPRYSSQSPSLVRCLRPPSLASTSTKISYLTSVVTSVRNDYDMICGTSTGSIIQWDTRSDGIIFSPHQIHNPNASVTSLTSHPNDHATIVSGGSDGSIASTEVDLFTTAGSRTKPSFLSSTTATTTTPIPSQVENTKLKILTDLYEIPMKEIFPCQPYFHSTIMSLDSSDMISRKILATGQLGEVSFLNI